MRSLAKKFKIKNSSIWLTVFVLIISVIAYVLCTYYINLSNLDMTKVNQIKEISKLQTVKDILLVVISISGTNLLLSLIIEVKSKNSLVTEILLNDVIAAPEFYKNMDGDKKEKMFNALEEHLYFNHSMNHLMYKGMRAKINDLTRDYYYESCSYIVTCNVRDTYIEKEITRTVKIKSYDDNYTLKDFSVGNCSLKKIEDKETYTLTSLEINGKMIDISKDVKPQESKVGKLDKRNKYDTCKKYVYKNPLKLSSTKETVIEVKCVTRTAIDDKSSTFRVVKPCKNFSLMFSVVQNEKYRLAVDAFGFLDDADDSANNDALSSVNITFNDWIFKYDGVVVIILDKK